MSDASAALLGALIGGGFLMLGVWLGFYLSRRGSEEDRRAEKLLTIYNETEVLWNLLAAVQKESISHAQFYPRWTATTENIMRALIGSGLDRKQILIAINGKWNDPKSVTALRALADELLEKLDPEYAHAAKEMLNDLGIKPEDIGQVILRNANSQDWR
jgi:uncharacterized protein YjiS (DUF1127 family)